MNLKVGDTFRYVGIEGENPLQWFFRVRGSTPQGDIVLFMYEKPEHIESNHDIGATSVDPQRIKYLVDTGVWKRIC